MTNPHPRLRHTHGLWNDYEVYSHVSTTENPLNFATGELEEIRNVTVDKYSLGERYENSSTSSTEGSNLKASLYTVVVPIMVFCCVLTVILNLLIVLSARWCRKPMSPTLYFSVSLALADAYVTFILGTGLLVNSFLPAVYGFELSPCFALTLEVFRLGGVLVSNVHLLALAMNHWIGIIRPLHYAATMTRRTAWIVILNAWVCPILLIFVYFSSEDGVGFRSERCSEWGFLLRRTFRAIFASLFFAPLFIMTLIYTHIFLIVRSSQQDRLRYQSSHQLQRNVKAVMTTVLILGTYILGWMPAILFNIIVCNDCVVHFKQVPEKVMYAMTIGVNTLVIIKAFLDPIIYALRMPDIQLALRKMRYELFKRCCSAWLNPVEPEWERGFSTKYNRSVSQDTKALRVSSFGSNSSSRRPGHNSVNSTPTRFQQHSVRSTLKNGRTASTLEMAEFPK